MLRSYFFKLLRSPLLYLGFLATLALCIYHMYSNPNDKVVLSGLNSLIGFDSYRKMFVLFAAIPFASNFADEWNSKSTISFITRKSVDNYACSNLIICYISAFAVVFAGMMIYILIGSISKPLCYTDNFAPPYGILCEGGAPLLALTLIVFVYASSCGMWAVMGLTATAFLPSKYIGICAPFVFCYIIERFSRNWPGNFSLGALSKSWSDLNPLHAFLWANFIFLFISACCGIVFIIKVKRRIENGIS